MPRSFPRPRIRPSIRALTCAVLFLLSPSVALAWNGAGHRLVATIAWQRLDPAARGEAVRLLRHHPDWPHWSAGNAGLDDSGRSAFIAASTWADELRRTAPRHEHSPAKSDGSTVLDPADGSAHGDWHYLNRPLDARGRLHPGTLGGNLDQALEQLPRILADPTQSDLRRAHALAWLIHLVGDAHQPLHTVTRLNAEGDDAGGNGLTIHDPSHPRLTQQPLHAWWDDRPGPPWLRGDKLLARAAWLDEATPPTPQRTSTEWLREAQQLARTVAYRDLGSEPITLDDAYRSTAQRTADRQIVAAGRRLAIWLDALLLIC